MPAKPAARNNDQQICTQPISGGGAHTGGPIIAAGAGLVFINQRAAAVVGDNCTCQELPCRIAEGSGTVFIGGKAVARQLDKTTHSPSMISEGSPDVFIGG
ncbi:PAAR domain-containing protein [Haliscomenobacter sp.]|uniref:PAAR domain-containing protein n=1 Tax=Haliscomenobacter sp. TaxID=2717303 RepID=UPI003592F935